MPYSVRPVSVWAVDVMNRPGMLSRVLEALTNAGARLEFTIARRVTDNTSRVFVAPVEGSSQTAAAADVGLTPARGLYTLRVEGPDRPGVAAALTRTLAGYGINLRGFSAASLGKKCALYMGFATPAEAQRAAEILKQIVTPARKTLRRSGRTTEKVKPRGKTLRASKRSFGGRRRKS